MLILLNLTSATDGGVRTFYIRSLIIHAVPPTGLEILEKPTYVSEGKSRVVTCQAIGGYPPPEITWWIGNRQLQPEQTVSAKQ